MSRSQRSTEQHYAAALLDTGASGNCISLDLCDTLQLSIEPGSAVIQTAVHHSDVETLGTVTAYLKWQDRTKILRMKAKPVLHVVEGLNASLILSHDFIKSHEDDGIWEVCDQYDTLCDSLAPFKIPKLRRDERQSETIAQDARNLANQQREDAEKDAKKARLQALFENTTGDNSQISPSSSRLSTDAQSSIVQQP